MIANVYSKQNFMNMFNDAKSIAFNVTSPLNNRCNGDGPLFVFVRIIVDEIKSSLTKVKLYTFY